MPHESSPPWIVPWNSEGLSNESVRRSVELASMAFDERIRGSGPLAWQDERAPLRRRRAIVGLSLIGFAGTLGSLCQMGLLRTQPAPRRPHSAEGAPASSVTDQQRLSHAVLSMVTHAVNIVLASLGSEARARRSPWVPIMAAGKAAADVGVAARYVASSRSGAARSWSGYAIVDAVARVGTCALAIPEAVDALRAMLVSQPAERRSE